METLINLYVQLIDIVRIVQQRIKKYYNAKKSKGLDLKGGGQSIATTQNFKSWRLSKKLDYIRLGPFRIIVKILKVIYKLDLPIKMKIYPI